MEPTVPGGRGGAQSPSAGGEEAGTVEGVRDPALDPEEIAEAGAAALHSAGVEGVETLVVLGSGWRDAAERLGSAEVAVAFEEIPGFARPSVAGHGGEVRLHRVGGRRVLVCLGRTHLYEGRGVDAVVHPVRVAARLGAENVVLTNGCGSVHPEWGAGSVVALSDHINLTGATPLVGPRFVDMTEVYSLRMRAVAHQVAAGLYEGVYAQMRGPQYETPAEVSMAKVLGADLVGMSTALEAIAARAEGMEVLGISLVTNTAAGVGGGTLSHAEVLEAGAAAAPRLGGILAEILEAV